ncbi:KasA/KasB family beta-ketoacyl-ACP synthase [Mycobacterium sp. WMMD1722]|uniref:KasA/KasB family beta-ketoacyl-ACP synthase n=1 Tax=Mycobacterium sp. WMMD1722 TaxID=3404117 RepID=UPI003BF51C73
MAALATGAGFPDVVVTAVASTTPLATDAEQTWQALLAGRSGIRALDAPFVDEFDLPVRIGGQLLENFESELNRVEQRRLSYQQKMSTVLGRRAWQNAGSPEVDSTRLMVSIGIGLGASEDILIRYFALQAKGLRAASPLDVQMFMPNAPAAAVGLDHKAKAGVLTPVLGDAAGAAGIAEAWRQIVLGEADVAICGGVEIKIETVPIAALSRLGRLSTNNDDPAGACRPFDAARDGLVFGEGGALMVLETEEHAKARGATILARLMGAGITSDSYDPVTPDPAGEAATEAISRALQRAGLTPGDVDLVKAHATGTVDGDRIEATAIGAALGSHSPAVYAPKSALGNSIGAAGAVEAVVTVQALRDGIVPPTLNLTDLDPEIALDVVAGEPRRGDFRYAVANSFGFGGNNVALAFGKY